MEMMWPQARRAAYRTPPSPIFLISKVFPHASEVAIHPAARLFFLVPGDRPITRIFKILHGTNSIRIAWKLCSEKAVDCVQSAFAIGP